MPLGLIKFQNRLRLVVKRRIDFLKTLMDVLMNGAFAYIKFLSGFPHGCVILNYVLGKLYCALFNIILQEFHRPFFCTIYEAGI